MNYEMYWFEKMQFKIPIQKSLNPQPVSLSTVSALVLISAFHIFKF